MKVGIIAANNIRFSPYVFYYTNILDELDIDYEVMLPNRNEDITDVFIEKSKIFSWDKNKKSIENYYIYAKKVKRYSKNRFDFMVVLTTNMAVFLSEWLRKNYAKKYIVDIRDYTYEKNKLFFIMEKRVLSNSALNIISSFKFKTFLPQNDYLVCHNNTWPKYKKNDEVVINKSLKIKIGYVGAIAYYNQCVRLMKLVNEDDRFELNFYGKGPAENELKKYNEILKCDRIRFNGLYCAEEKEKIIKSVDIMFNAYGNNNPLLDYALSNKLYDALYFCKPILNSPGTYMSEMSGILSFNIDLDSAENLNDLYSWYMNLNSNILKEFSDRRYEQIVVEDNDTKSCIKKEFLKIKREV